MTYTPCLLCCSTRDRSTSEIYVCSSCISKLASLPYDSKVDFLAKITGEKEKEFLCKLFFGSKTTPKKRDFTPIKPNANR